MTLVIESPNEIYSIKNNSFKIFLAGGISYCSDWQSEMIKLLKKRRGIYSDTDITIYNPRRVNFPIDDPDAAEEQITWEYNHLRDADIILFWFSKGSLNPIVLYELGRWGFTGKKIVIGIDPDYERKQDVMIQSKLSGYDMPFYDNLNDTAAAIMLRCILLEKKNKTQIQF